MRANGKSDRGDGMIEGHAIGRIAENVQRPTSNVQRRNRKNREAGVIRGIGLGQIDKRKIEITTPIKSTGEHEATVRLRDDLVATITLQVVPGK